MSFTCGCSAANLGTIPSLHSTNRGCAILVKGQYMCSRKVDVALCVMMTINGSKQHANEQQADLQLVAGRKDCKNIVVVGRHVVKKHASLHSVRALVSCCQLQPTCVR